MVDALLMTGMFLVAVFLILLVLVQRGRGGGLTGALGGMGGQSAFGTKAGDLFTRITVGAAAAWILLCVLAVTYYNRGESFDATLGAGAVVPSQSELGGPVPPAGATVPPSGATVPPSGATVPPAGEAAKGPDLGQPAAPVEKAP